MQSLNNAIFGMNHVISELHYKWTNIQKHYRKMTIGHVIKKNVLQRDNFTTVLQENDHFMVIFLLYFCKIPWQKDLGATK